MAQQPSRSQFGTRWLFLPFGSSAGQGQGRGRDAERGRPWHRAKAGHSSVPCAKTRAPPPPVTEGRGRGLQGLLAS